MVKLFEFVGRLEEKCFVVLDLFGFDKSFVEVKEEVFFCLFFFGDIMFFCFVGNL